MHLYPGRQCLEQSPLGAGQVLEPVREHGCGVPGAEVARDPFERACSQHAAVPRAQPFELPPVGKGQHCEIGIEQGRVDETRFQLRQRACQGVGEAREAGRASQPVQIGGRDDTAQHKGALGVPDHAPSTVPAAG